MSKIITWRESGRYRTNGVRAISEPLFKIRVVKIWPCFDLIRKGQIFWHEVKFNSFVNIEAVDFAAGYAIIVLSHFITIFAKFIDYINNRDCFWSTQTEKIFLFDVDWSTNQRSKYTHDLENEPYGISPRNKTFFNSFDNFFNWISSIIFNRKVLKYI